MKQKNINNNKLYAYQIIKFYKLKDKLAILNFINININTDIDIYIKNIEI